MARTWLGTSAAFSSVKFDEGPQTHYDLRRTKDHVLFSVTKGDSEPHALPVETMIGGQRHGISFLLTLNQLSGGLSLERPAMLEARYALLPTGALVLSPGFPKEAPADLEHELGRVLTPGFQTRCLTCHGMPGTLGAGKEGGVHCESCHGPASAHVASVNTFKPKSLKGNASMQVCAQCHSGFKPRAHADPVPADLLVSSQIPSLRHSECFIQSGEQLTCTSCHNPHQDSTTLAQSSVNVCLRCHSLSFPQHAAICPINRTQNCIGCHMPKVQVDAFRVTDHWIRVLPDLPSPTHSPDPSLRSQVTPKREFLRLIEVPSDGDIQAVANRLSKGESFSSVARALSKDQASAAAGGFIGEVSLSDMDPTLSAAAAHLDKGATSGVIQVGNRRIMLHRLPRDFKWQADQLVHEAQTLNDQGNRAEAIQKVKQALDAYPYQLKGLVLMGMLLRQSGNVSRAAGVLGFAAQLYPEDAATLFDFAMVQNSPDQIAQLRRVIELDPDLLAAYQSLGTALYADGQRAAAIETFRAGLKINPLSAILYYDLGLALQEQGDAPAAANALALAARLDAKIAARLGH